MLCLYACKKDGSQPSLIGKWNIVKITYHQAHDTTINETSSDYYNFSPNGNLGAQDDEGSFTGIYSLNGTKSVNITIYTVDGHGLGVTTPPAVFTISNFTEHSVVLTSPPYPSGQEVVFLQK